jgi:hypothetical protein
MRDVFKLCEEADADVTKGPHGWIQWKGTDVCMDVHCSCGERTHVDASFAYTITCGACGKLWAVCSNVRLVEISQDELQGRCSPVRSDI